MEESAFIALGSNEGDRELNLLKAVAAIGKLPASRITALSGFYETEPVGPVVQNNFINAVIRLTTSLSPEELLDELLRIETGLFRRKRTVPQGPRPMDLDLLFYGSQVRTGASLTLPHPRLHERRFVLQPLAEIAPDFSHPVLQRTIARLLTNLPAGQTVTKI